MSNGGKRLVLFFCLILFLSTTVLATTIPTYNITKRATQPASPAGVSYDVAYNHNGTYIAVGHATSPFLTIYIYNSSEASGWSKLPSPTTLPPGLTDGVDFNANGTLLSTVSTISPYMANYIFNLSDPAHWSKLPNPSTTPPGAANHVRVSADGQWMAVGHAAGQTLSFYAFNASTNAYWTKQPNLATAPGGVSKVAFSNDTNFLEIAGAGSTPRQAVYIRNVTDAAGWTRLPLPYPTPTGQVRGAGFEVNSTRMFATTGTLGPPWFWWYDYQSSNLTWMNVSPSPSNLPSAITYAIRVSPDNGLFGMALGAGGSPFVSFAEYNSSDSSNWTVKAAVTATPDYTYDLDFNPNMTEVAFAVLGATGGGPYLQIYNITSYGTVPSAGQIQYNVTTTNISGGSNPLVFNASINGTHYTTTNGSIITDALAASVVVNVSLNASWFWRLNTTMLGTINITNYTFNLSPILYNLTFNATEPENTWTMHNLTINNTVPAEVIDMTANITYAGTTYVATRTGQVFNVSVWTGWNTLPTENRTFNWTFTIYYSDGYNDTYVTNNSNQTVTSAGNYTKFLINATNTTDGSYLTTFNVSINGTFYNTTNGSILSGNFLKSLVFPTITNASGFYRHNNTISGGGNLTEYQYNLTTINYALAYEAVVLNNTLTNFSLDFTGLGIPADVDSFAGYLVWNNTWYAATSNGTFLNVTLDSGYNVLAWENRTFYWVVNVTYDDALYSTHVLGSGTQVVITFPIPPSGGGSGGSPYVGHVLAFIATIALLILMGFVFGEPK